MARTAVVAGTASAVAGGVRNRQAGRAEEAAAPQPTALAASQSQAEVASLQAQLAEVEAAPTGPAGGVADLAAELTKLGELKAAGVLSDEEFAAAKAKLLA